MTATILITDQEAADRANVASKLNQLNVDITVHQPENTFEFSPEETRARLHDVNIIVTALSTIDASVIKAGNELTYIVKTGVGIDNIDVDAATRKGVLVSRTPGVNDQGIAEHVIGMAINLNKRLLEADRRLRHGEWDFRSALSGDTYELQGKTIGIIGFGAIGQRLAEIATGVGMDALAYDPYVEDEAMTDIGAEPIDLDELLSGSDIISVNCLLTDETHHLIGAEEFQRMADDAFLINTARGPIVDEKALNKALDTNVIAGAGLDVFEQEPPASDNPLFDRENTVVTPHIAGTTYEGYQRIGDAAVDDIQRFLEGSLPAEEHIVNPEVLSSYQHPYSADSY